MKQKPLKLEYFQNQKFDLILRGDSYLTHHVRSIPELWREALMNLRAVDDAVEEIWSPVIKNARGMIFRMVNMTHDLGLVLSPENIFPPKLLYITDETTGWLGGSPATASGVLEREKELGFALPGAYVRFARIHNGFLENGVKEVGILPIELARIYSRFENLDSDTGGDSNANDLLAFCAYRSGNMQCFDLASPVGARESMTVQWDHETKELSQPESFWAFIKRFAIDFLKV